MLFLEISWSENKQESSNFSQINMHILLYLVAIIAQIL